MFHCWVYASCSWIYWTFSFQIHQDQYGPTCCIYWYNQLMFITFLNFHKESYFVGSGLFHLINVVYCIFLKEPRKIEESRKISLKSLFSVSHFIDSLRTVTRKRKHYGREKILCLLLGLFVLSNVLYGELDILYIFLLNIGAAQVFDYVLGLKNILGAISLLVILPLTKWIFFIIFIWKKQKLFL